jgi:hypothetical protein
MHSYLLSATGPAVGNSLLVAVDLSTDMQHQPAIVPAAIHA